MTRGITISSDAINLHKLASFRQALYNLSFTCKRQMKVRHSPRKRFGQNFLHDKQVIEQIIQAIHPQSTDNMLEIGPGLGALTQPLLRELDQLKAIEIDRDLQAYLPTLPGAQGKLIVIPADALTVDYSQFGEQVRVIGNLPYNISSPLLIHLLQQTACIEDMHFMLQKELVDRMASSHGCKAYGRLSVMVQYYCEVEHLFDVPPEAFDPAPKVNSAIVRMTPYQKSPYEKVAFADLERIVAVSFSMRRKTLNNNLKGLISAEQLLELGIDGIRRPEQISVAEYVCLAKFISK